MLFVLLIPILCSTDKKLKSVKRSKKNVISNHVNAIVDKDTQTYVEPEAPYHFSDGFEINNIRYNLYLLDSTINVVRRSSDYYYKWVFSYKKTVEADKTLSFNSVAIDEEKSKFLFSRRASQSECTVDKGVEYSYKVLDQSCKDKSEIKDVISKVQSASKLSCILIHEGGITVTFCDMELGNSNVELINFQSLEEINYKLDNMRIGTYSPSKVFEIGDDYTYTNVNENRIISVQYDSNYFTFQNKSITVEDKANYTDVDGDYYLCLTSDCKYVCNIDSGNYDSNWGFYSEPCYRPTSGYDGFLNKAYNKVYNDVKNYNPSQNNNLRRSLLEENGNSAGEKKKKVLEGEMGYYHEDLSSGYKGYFLIGNELTIIEQGMSAKQLKLVLKIDEVANSVKVDSFDDIKDVDVVDEDKSSVEPRYSETCKTAITFKSLKSQTQQCGISFDENLFNRYLRREYNITKPNSKTILTIYREESGNYIEERRIEFNEYDSTQLQGIINKITSYTKFIPADKCLKFNETKTNSELKASLHNKVVYISEYESDDNNKEYSFSYDEVQNNNQEYSSYSGNIGSYYFADIGENQYMMREGTSFYHEYVGFKANEYVVCDNVKNDAIQDFINRVNEIKGGAGFNDDGSVEYMVNIFLFTLLLVLLY